MAPSDDRLPMNNKSELLVWAQTALDLFLSKNLYLIRLNMIFANNDFIEGELDKTEKLVAELTKCRASILAMTTNDIEYSVYAYVRNVCELVTSFEKNKAYCLSVLKFLDELENYGEKHHQILTRIDRYKSSSIRFYNKLCGDYINKKYLIFYVQDFIRNLAASNLNDDDINFYYMLTPTFDHIK